MAISTSLGQFSKRMAIVAKEIANNGEKAVRRAAVAADTAIVTTTPVNTGRAKGNWNASVGSEDISTSDVTDPSGQATMSAHQQTIEQWRLGKGPIFLANGLPYILPLENGSSSQAPTGMTQHGIDAARAQLQAAKLLG